MTEQQISKKGLKGIPNYAWYANNQKEGLQNAVLSDNWMIWRGV